MITGDLIINQSEKMTEILSNELNESNRTPFLHLYIPRSFFISPMPRHNIRQGETKPIMSPTSKH